MARRKSRLATKYYESACESCMHAEREHRGHPMYLYRIETRGTTKVVVEEENPDYVPLEFPCSHEGCSCAVKLEP